LRCRLQAEMRGDHVSSAAAHPAVDALGIIDDFRDGAVESEKAVRQVERVAGLCKRSHSAHEIRAAAADYDIERRRPMPAEMLAQGVTHRSEGLVDVGVVGFSADD